MRALNDTGCTRAVALAAVLAATAFGCAGDDPEPVPVAGEFTVGAHRIELVVPDGWQSLDHGLERRFRRESTEIRLGDHGPVTPDAFVREIEHARRLFRIGHADDGRARIAATPLRQAFGGTRAWQPADAAWKTLSHSRARMPDEHELDAAFSTVLFSVSTFAQPTLREVVDRLLPTLGGGVQREIAEVRAFEIDGREALRVETWDRLSHDHRAWFLFVLNEGNLLVLQTGPGQEDRLRPAFETIATSLRFGNAPAR